MKYSIIVMMMLAMLVGEISALPVGRDTAERVAEGRLHRDERNDSFYIADCTVLEDYQSRIPIAYVFELMPVGYIITAAETDIAPVIAYSYTNNCITDGESESVLLDMIRKDLVFRLALVGMVSPEIQQMHRDMWMEYSTGEFALPDSGLPEQWPPAGSTPTEGWLEENWSQGDPYNRYCPMDLIAGQRSVAGCPAVAMASILNFGEETNGTRFDDYDDYYHNYHEYYWIDDDYVAHEFPSWSELNVYMDTLESHYENQITLTKLDKAALVYSCGAACKQVYTASISGTFGVEQAYDAYLKFNFTDCELLDATSDSLFDKLSENMMNAMPAHLAVVDSVPQYGHNLIIDGYNTDEFYHLNFGWGGSCNGWYQFPLHGMPYGMNIIEGIILDIGAGLQSIEENILENGTSILSLSIQSNPVSEYLEIGLSVSMQCTAEISVFDISGRKITTVARGEFSAGSHILGWDSSGLGKGVYVILAADSHGVVTAKFTVLHGDK